MQRVISLLKTPQTLLINLIEQIKSIYEPFCSEGWVTGLLTLFLPTVAHFLKNVPRFLPSLLHMTHEEAKVLCTRVAHQTHGVSGDRLLWCGPGMCPLGHMKRRGKMDISATSLHGA